MTRAKTKGMSDPSTCDMKHCGSSLVTICPIYYYSCPWASFSWKKALQRYRHNLKRMKDQLTTHVSLDSKILVTLKCPELCVKLILFLHGARLFISLSNLRDIFLHLRSIYSSTFAVARKVLSLDISVITENEFRCRTKLTMLEFGKKTKLRLIVAAMPTYLNKERHELQNKL